eukprot:TRINITY_DN996_c0_g2_i1.p1 TRINITY_DN996_c0_g2~~TRINITY_DN996_c0_g2_i1.p1  ORF type:complete len:911 (+),score=230.29 TRINITY_DN996_c0_g2_i1:245-2977(+)
MIMISRNFGPYSANSPKKKEIFIFKKAPKVEETNKKEKKYREMMARTLVTTNEINVNIMINNRKRLFTFSANSLIFSVIEKITKEVGLRDKTYGLFMPSSNSNDPMWLLPHVPIWHFGLNYTNYIELKEQSEEEKNIMENMLHIQVQFPNSTEGMLMCVNPNIDSKELLLRISQKTGLKKFSAKNKYVIFHQKNHIEGIYLKLETKLRTCKITSLSILEIRSNDQFILSSKEREDQVYFSSKLRVSQILERLFKNHEKFNELSFHINYGQDTLVNVNDNEAIFKVPIQIGDIIEIKDSEKKFSFTVESIPFVTSKIINDHIEHNQIFKSLELENGEYIEEFFIDVYCGDIHGMLIITNGYLRFRKLLKLINEEEPNQLYLTMPIQSISNVTKVKAEKSLSLFKITQKSGNFQYFYIHSELDEIFRESLKEIAFNPKVFAFSYRLPSEESQWVDNIKLSSNITGVENVRVEKRKISENNGWSLFKNFVPEFKRMNIPNGYWRITKINEEYKLCSTYPATLVVPSDVDDDTLKKVAKFRSLGRIPTLSYLHSNSASISRCAQPLVGLKKEKNEFDLKMINSILATNTTLKLLYIIDARPFVNAIANNAVGKGYELAKHYPNCKIEFMDIPNIHVIRECNNKLRDFVSNPSLLHDPEKWMSHLESTGWLSRIYQLLNTAVKITNLTVQGNSVLVHCSDGWDRTSQLTSLSMLLLDPYYRTLYGFQVLIEKEWLSFGHKFARRCGHDPKAISNPSDGERSPIFLQFLECIWQLLNVYPSHFEFNKKLLNFITEELFSCKFGTFLFNCEQQRSSENVTEKTESIWSYINFPKNKSTFLNPLYDPNPKDILSQPIFPYQVTIWKELYLSRNLQIFKPPLLNQSKRSSGNNIMGIKEGLTKSLRSSKVGGFSNIDDI